VCLSSGTVIQQAATGLEREFYLRRNFGGLNKTPGAISREEMNEYVLSRIQLRSTLLVRIFRAAADIDLEMDKADEAAGRKIECPLHVLWGQRIQSAPWGTCSPLGEDLLAELRQFLS